MDQHTYGESDPDFDKPNPMPSQAQAQAEGEEALPDITETTADGETNLREDAYWHENLRLLGGLMAIWFAASFGAGILFREYLDQFRIGGYPLGFWFAQQGSIYVFIALIFYYVVKMKQIERKYDLDD
jgi:putative solute:sodium symporter small subunit